MQSYAKVELHRQCKIEFVGFVCWNSSPPRRDYERLHTNFAIASFPKLLQYLSARLKWRVGLV